MLIHKVKHMMRVMKFQLSQWVVA